MTVSTTRRERRRFRRPKRSPQARVFPNSRAPGSSAPCGAAEIVNAAADRDAAAVRMNIGLNSTRIKVSGTNSTGVRC
jgi:hypothetical protein